MSNSMETASAREARRLKHYPLHKDSGVDGVGEIPSHWEVVQLKYGAGKIGSGKTPSGGAEVYVSEGIMLLRSQNVHPQGLRLDDVAFIDSQTDSQMAGSRVREGDVLLNITGASLGRCCEARLSGRAANVNQHVCVIRPRTELFVPAFLAAALASQSAQGQIFSTENGVSRDALNFEQIGGLFVTRPTLGEQRFIAAFLDRETARIDALLAKKERLIELLQEQRSALITRAVTKGLDLNVQMKNSGVDWIGEIPAHWSVNRTKFAARLRSGHTPSRLHPEYWQNCEIPWFGLADVWQIRDGEKEFVHETAEKISALGLANSSARLLPKGTVLLSRTASVGFSAIMDVDMATTQDFVNWVCGATIQPDYLLYVFRSMQQEFRRLTMGSTHQTIYMPDIGGFSTPIPPMPEQAAIVAFIREKTARSDELVRTVQNAIERLKELRTALISAAVTGKIDVRGEVA